MNTIDPARLARLAGAFYLIIIVCGIWTQVFVRGEIIVAGDAAATARNLIAHEALFRMGFAAETIMAIADVAVTVLFVFIFWPVSRVLAVAAAAFHTLQTAVLVGNTLNSLNALLLVTGTGITGAFGAQEAGILAQHSLALHAQGYSLALIFFGVNCVLLGWLIIRSSFLPSLIGVLMIAAGLVYLILGEVRFLAPDQYGALTMAFLVCLVAEGGLALWLTAFGVNKERWQASAN